MLKPLFDEALLCATDACARATIAVCRAPRSTARDLSRTPRTHPLRRGVIDRRRASGVFPPGLATDGV